MQFTQNSSIGKWFDLLDWLEKDRVTIISFPEKVSEGTHDQIRPILIEYLTKLKSKGKGLSFRFELDLDEDGCVSLHLRALPMKSFLKLIHFCVNRILGLFMWIHWMW